MNALQTKAIRATERFCEHRGCRVLATKREGTAGFSADVVAEDADGTICFIDVTVTRRGEGELPEATTKRVAWEIAAADWLAENEYAVDRAIRFDRCDLLVVGSGDRALLRYARDVLSASL